MKMNVRSEAVARLLKVAVGGACLLLVACDSSVNPEDPGTLEVGVATSGDMVDPAGYSLALDGVTREESVDLDDTVVINDLAPGEYEVELGDMAVNCGVEGENPRTVAVPAGGRARTDFDVTCAAPREQVIAFSRLQNGVWDIWIMDEDGSRQDNLTDGPSQDMRPMTSRDGSRVAFESDRDGATDVWTMLIDGSGKQNVTQSPYNDVHPTWFADGTRIAFASDREGEYDIWLMDPDGSNMERITDAAGEDRQPAVSPDGTRIAFTSDRDGTTDIWVMDLDGSNLENLTSSGDEELRPAWFPDGDRLTFFSDREGAYDVWVMDADGSNPENLTQNPGSWDVEPAVSLDGTRIAFNSDREGNPCQVGCGLWDTNADIWVMDVDGSNLVNLTDSPDTHEEDAAWES